MAKRYKTVNIDRAVHREAKLLAMIDETTITAIVEELLRKLLKKRSGDIERMRSALGINTSQRQG